MLSISSRNTCPWRVSSATDDVDRRMASEVAAEMWFTSSTERLISSLVADCCSAAVAMERT